VSLELDEHRQYLADSVRIDAFTRALAATIRPGDIVLDLASGTGILGLLACQAGAAKVYAVDDGPIIGLARDLAAANGFADRIEFIRHHSEWVTLPERVDVIVTDQIGRLGFDAGLFEYLADARDRLAKPAARLIPRAIELWFVPCEHDELRSVVDFWQTTVAGLDLRPAETIARSTGYPFWIEPQHPLSTPQRVTTTDFSQPASEFLEGRADFIVSRDGRFDALGGWFRAELSPGIWMTNGPGGAHINRRQALLAVNPPIAVSPGDRIRAHVRIRPTTSLIAWTIEVASADGTVRERRRRSTFEGILVSTEDMTRSEPGRVPRLSRAGQIRSDVLSLCDGQRTLGAIETTLYQRHVDFFTGRDAAARFVSEVLRRYGE